MQSSYLQFASFIVIAYSIPKTYNHVHKHTHTHIFYLIKTEEILMGFCTKTEKSGKKIKIHNRKH